MHTCVICCHGKGKLRPTHIIPVTVILCEVHLKPGVKNNNITLKVRISQAAHRYVHSDRYICWGLKLTSLFTKVHLAWFLVVLC